MCFFHLETALLQLQSNLFAGIVEFHSGNSRGSTAGTNLVLTFEPIPNGNAKQYAHIPNACKLALKTIVEIRIGEHVASRQRHLRQESSAHQFRGLLTHLNGILQHLQFVTVGIGCFVAVVFHVSSHGEHVLAFVS